MENLNLIDTVDKNELLKINFPQYDDENTKLFYMIIDVQEYINELYHDYKVVAKEALDENNFEYLEGLVKGDWQNLAPDIDEDKILDKCALANRWGDNIPQSKTVLKQMEYFDAKYGLIIYQPSFDYETIELQPITKIAMETLIKDRNHPNDVFPNWDEDLLLGDKDKEYFQKLINICKEESQYTWVDCSFAYPKTFAKCVLKTNIKE